MSDDLTHKNVGNLSIDLKMLGLQAVAASTAGLIGTPLMNISNKSTLPGITLNQVLTKARAEPFLGAPWSMVRQFVSSIRGTVGIAVLSRSADSHENRLVSWGSYWTAVFAGSLAETLLAGVFIEIPETRVQSGFPRYSRHAVKCFPFVLCRNFMTALSPTYFVMLRINEPDDKEPEWLTTIGRTFCLSTIVAIACAPIQGVSTRVIQEQTVVDAIKNTRGDFRWASRKVTFARVFSRALYTGITGSAITLAYLGSKVLSPSHA
jgi:hypothetical protein